MEFAQATVHKSGNQLHVTHGDDRGLYVTFSMEAVQNAFKSEQEGHPVFEEIPHVQILFPGDSTKKVFRPVDLKGSESRPSDPDRWPAQWAAFLAQAEQAAVGMPLTEWSPMTKSMALTLKAMSIHTVEQLSEIPDHALTWLGAREMREKAKAWLAAATDGAAVLKLQQENANLKADIEALKAQFAELAKPRKSRQNEEQPS